jgi:hypothetical protein
MLLLPYYTLLFGGFGGKLSVSTFWGRGGGMVHFAIGGVTLADENVVTASMYMMSRLVLGHKTWFGKD